MHDTILDWDQGLPSEEMHKSELVFKQADLVLCLGTTLQIMPCGNYPLLASKNGAKIVVINLQPTRIDDHAYLIIHQKLDFVFKILIEDIMKICFFRDKSPSIEINLKLEHDSENDNEKSSIYLSIKNIVIEK